MPQLQRVLIATAALLFIVGVGLAVARPGGLSDDNLETAENTTTTSSTTSTSAAPTSVPPSNETADPTAPGGTDTPQTPGTPTSAPGAATTTTAPDQTGQSGSGSGLGSSGTPTVVDVDNGLPVTGHDSLFVLSALVLAAGLGVGRVARD